MMYTLIGMPGVGKSCMARAVASKLKMRALDGDRLIVKRMGMPLWQILETYGTDGFQKIEEETLLSVSGDRILLATGGSAVYYPRVMEHCRAVGRTIYLSASLPVILERLGDFSKRGIVLREGQTIRDLYEERTALYEKYADFTVSCNGNAYSRYQAEVMRVIEASEKDAALALALPK